jgi:hypothetical protein
MTNASKVPLHADTYITFMRATHHGYDGGYSTANTRRISSASLPVYQASKMGIGHPDPDRKFFNECAERAK